ncbi:hypothetical protein IQ07DRAFT_341184 [Pyrenochaeta sp. DS3sAY3a]|nr:hypothetical protein IQ07DRAFT_341184 [Pyrenochaeta sp. DS3sAY3a]
MRVQKTRERAAGAAANREDRVERFPLLPKGEGIANPSGDCVERRDTATHVLFRCRECKDLRNGVFGDTGNVLYTKLKTSTPHNSPSMDSREAIDDLKPGEKTNHTQIAARHGMQRRTLSRRRQGVCSSLNTTAENQLALHPRQEPELVWYMERAQGKSMIRNSGSQIGRKKRSLACAVPGHRGQPR